VIVPRARGRIRCMRIPTLLVTRFVVAPATHSESGSLVSFTGVEPEGEHAT